MNGGGNLVPVFGSFSGGLYAGIAKDVKKKNAFTFQPGLQYSYYTYGIVDNGSKKRDGIHNIQLPLSFRFDMGKRAGVGFGPQFSVTPRASGKYRLDPVRPAISSMNIVSLSGFLGPYFRVNPQLAIELRAILDTYGFGRSQWEWQYMVVQFGASWSITKPATE